MPGQIPSISLYRQANVEGYRLQKMTSLHGLKKNCWAMTDDMKDVLGRRIDSMNFNDPIQWFKHNILESYSIMSCLCTRMNHKEQQGWCRLNKTLSRICSSNSVMPQSLRPVPWYWLWFWHCTFHRHANDSITLQTSLLLTGCLCMWLAHSISWSWPFVVTRQFQSCERFYSILAGGSFQQLESGDWTATYCNSN